MAAGPLVGGFLVDALGWRSIFLVNVPLGLAGLAMTARVARSPIVTAARSLDLAGQACAVIALGGVTACLIEGPSLG